MKRLLLALAAVGALLFAGLPAQAAEKVAYDKQVLAAAEAAGKPILIAVHAPWCPVCRKQGPIIDKLAVTPEFKDLVVLVVDFDSQKDVLKTWNVQKQGTLIVLHGKQERDRATGIVDEWAIVDLLRKADG